MKTVSKKYPHLTFENGIWRGISKTYPDIYFQIGRRLLETLKGSPNFVGQLDSSTGKEDTFGMMMDRSIRCALWLKKQGIGPGDVISVSTHNHLDTIIPILASLYVGSILNTFLINSLDKDLLSHSIKLVKPKLIFSNEETAKLIQKYNEEHGKTVKVIVFGNVPGCIPFDEILNQQTPTEIRNFQCVTISSPKETAMIMFTSGSTGYPKALEISYRFLVQDVNAWLPQSVLYHACGTWYDRVCWIVAIVTAFSAIINHSTFIIHDYLQIADFCKIVEKYRINWMMLGVQQMNMISKLDDIKQYDFSTIKFIRYCGSRISLDADKRFHEVFPKTWLSQAYGLSEIGSVTAAMDDHKCPSCGIPEENIEIKVQKSDKHTVKTYESGEICVRTPDLKVSYFKSSIQIENALDSDGWYHTGDLGYYDENGEFFIVDRIKEIIKFRSDDVPPGTIEDCILQHPAVAQVGVVPKYHDEDMEQPMAFIVKKPNAQVTEEEIKTFVEKNLPDRMKLRGGVVFLDNMPYNTSHKISKRELRRLANNS